MASLTDINGIGPVLAERLGAAGITTIEAVASATPASLAQVQGLSIATATKVIAEAQMAVGPSDTTVSAASMKEPEAKSKRDAQVATLKKMVAQFEAKAARLEKQLAESIQAFKSKESGKAVTAKLSALRTKTKRK